MVPRTPGAWPPRRATWIRLDSKEDCPWERTGPADERSWKHHPLLGWAAEHRSELVWATLVLAQNWIVTGRPRFSGRTLGSYEAWSSVVGGILEAADIEGFLGREALNEFYEAADIEGSVLRTFVSAWSEKFGENEVGIAELFPVALESEGFDLGKGSDRSQRTVLGKRLLGLRDCVIGDYRLVKTREVKWASRWRLLPRRTLLDAEAAAEKAQG